MWRTANQGVRLQTLGIPGLYGIAEHHGIIGQKGFGLLLSEGSDVRFVSRVPKKREASGNTLASRFLLWMAPAAGGVTHGDDLFAGSSVLPSV